MKKRHATTTPQTTKSAIPKSLPPFKYDDDDDGLEDMCLDHCEPTKRQYPPGKEPESDSAAAISLVALAKTPDDAVKKVSASFGCSLAKLSESDSDGDDDPSEIEASTPDDAGSQGLLFELAAIHSTILKLEQRADLVPKLEAQIDQLKTDLANARVREITALQEVERLSTQKKIRVNDLSSDDDMDLENKRPRLISFDADQAETGASPNCCRPVPTASL